MGTRRGQSCSQKMHVEVDPHLMSKQASVDFFGSKLLKPKKIVTQKYGERRKTEQIYIILKVKLVRYEQSHNFLFCNNKDVRQLLFLLIILIGNNNKNNILAVQKSYFYACQNITILYIINMSQDFKYICILTISQYIIFSIINM